MKQNSNIELNWNASDELLNNISVKLFENGTTCSETNFIDVFEKKRKCEIKKRFRFFVMLVYALIDYEKPLLKTKNNTGRGVITAASKCFFENTKDGESLISLLM
ncbi:MAG: hypothetical protein IPF75_17690 [Bacteroidetes bacterium]|nr:hypothetical protein [Bacteroidota bacterium]